MLHVPPVHPLKPAALPFRPLPPSQTLWGSPGHSFLVASSFCSTHRLLFRFRFAYGSPPSIVVPAARPNKRVTPFEPLPFSPPCVPPAPHPFLLCHAFFVSGRCTAKGQARHTRASSVSSRRPRSACEASGQFESKTPPPSAFVHHPELHASAHSPRVVAVSRAGVELVDARTQQRVSARACTCVCVCVCARPSGARRH